MKLVLCSYFPLSVHAGALYDDAWAVDAANNIAAGQWLGSYTDVTLIKNIGFPLYLAALIKGNIPYLFATALLYILAVVFFCVAIKPLVKRNWLFFCIFILLLFCPVSFATDTFGRVYRNSVTAAQVLLIFGSFLGMYIRLKQDGESLKAMRLLPWSIVGSLGFAWFWISREDSIWIVPFVLVALIIMHILLIKQRVHSASVGRTIACVVLLLLPLGATSVSTTTVETLNQHYYGVQTKAEINSGNFARFIKDLYTIKPNKLPENLRVACPHESVEQAYKVSPTLASIKDYVEERFYNWGDVYDNNPGDGQVNGGEFFWVFRLAVSRAGIYSSATNVDAFFGACADEIEQAFAQGKLERRKVMPSSIMSPWRSEYASQLLPTMAQIYAHCVSYTDVTTQPFSANGDSSEISLFETSLHGHAYWDGQSVPLSCSIGMGIIWVYRVLGIALALAGFCCFVALLAVWVRQHKKTNTNKKALGSIVLILAALFFSVFALICGLTYTQVSSFIPINSYYYASAAYVLLLAFNVMSVASVVSFLIEHSRKKTTYKAKDSQEEKSCLCEGDL